MASVKLISNSKFNADSDKTDFEKEMISHTTEYNCVKDLLSFLFFIGIEDTSYSTQLAMCLWSIYLLKSQ